MNRNGCPASPESAPEVVVIDECLREALKLLEQAARASRRLGGKLYWEIRVAEKRR